jgi:hypothetical protein
MHMSWKEYCNHKHPTIVEHLTNPAVLTCLRCGWAWYFRGAGPEGEDAPVCCPHCKSAYWNEPRKHYVCINCRRLGDARDCAHCAQLRSRAVAQIEAGGKRVCPRCRKYGPVPNCRACAWMNDPAPANEPVGSAPAGDATG